MKIFLQYSGKVRSAMNTGTIKKVKTDSLGTRIMVHLDLNTEIDGKKYNVWILDESPIAILIEENEFLSIDKHFDCCKELLTCSKKCDFEIADGELTSITFICE